MVDLNEIKNHYIDLYYQRRKLENLEDLTETEVVADEFLENLIKEGSIPCDRTNATFDENFKIPHFYNEKLFKAGQTFCLKHLSAICFAKILGLTTLLAYPTSAILTMTNKSSTPRDALKRYFSTFNFLMIWYTGELKPGSRLWNSLKAVRAMHNSVSNSSNVKFKARLCQYEMSGTLFGFMGYALIRSEMVGIYHTSESELEGFIHFWRVIGCMLGTEDRFNMCKGSVEETKAICNLMIKRLVKETLRNPCKDFYDLSKAFYGALSYTPFHDVDVHICYIYMVLDNNCDIKVDEVKCLNEKQKIELSRLIYVLYLFRYSVFRIIMNFILRFAFQIARFYQTIDLLNLRL